MNTRFSSFTRTLLLPLAMAVSFLEAQTASARAGQPVGMGSPPSVAAGARARASTATAPGDDKTSPAPAPSDDAQYAPLWLYQGNWIVTPKNAVAGAKPDRLENQCGKIGRYFACQQTVNGKVGSLINLYPRGEIRPLLHPGCASRRMGHRSRRAANRGRSLDLPRQGRKQRKDDLLPHHERVHGQRPHSL
jgi:hypothetical protein